MEATGDKATPARDIERQDGQAANARIAELEAENATLRRALVDAGAIAGSGGRPHPAKPEHERSTRAASAAEAEVRHGRPMATIRADLPEAAENNARRHAASELTADRAALRERDERLRLTLDSALDYAIFTTDLGRRVTSWNLGAARLLGWEEAEIVGQSTDITFTREDREAGAPEHEAVRALAEGHARNERWHQRKDGSRFWGSGMVMPLRDPATEPGAPPLGLIKVMRDQTERQRAEEALRESEARWRGVFEWMHEGFALCEMVHDADGAAIDFRYLEANAAWERLTGLPAAATVGRLASDIFPGIEEFWLRTYARVVETGEPAHFEHRLGPVKRWFEVLAYRIEPGRFAALFLNVTERRAIGERREAMIDLSDRLRDLQDPAEIAHLAAAVIGKTLGASRAGFGTVDAAAQTFRVERDWTNGQTVSSAGNWRLDDFWTGFSNDLRQGKVVAIADVTEASQTVASAANYLATGVRAFLNVPVIAAGRIVAILYVQDTAPRQWSAAEIGFLQGVAERAWAAAGRARAEERRALLVNELNHRVKNTLAVVQSIADQTARGAENLSSFSAAFQARLIALARAHDLLTQEHWEGATLDAVLRAALEPLVPNAAQVDLSGCVPGIVLPPATALALAMAVHELGTNARRYGALSVPAGRISITCHPSDPDATDAVMAWAERGGPPVKDQPARRGFGLRLLQRGLAAEAGMGADIRFEPEGLHCTLRLPLAPTAPPADNV
jgi:PAS domain S-box-containing protein